MRGPKDSIGQKRELLWWKITSANLFFVDSGPRQKCSFFSSSSSSDVLIFVHGRVSRLLTSCTCFLYAVGFVFLGQAVFLSSSEALCFPSLTLIVTYQEKKVYFSALYH